MRPGPFPSLVSGGCKVTSREIWIAGAEGRGTGVSSISMFTSLKMLLTRIILLSIDLACRS